MRPDPASHAPNLARALTKAQREAILLLRRDEPLKQSTSGLPGSTFKSLRTKGLATHGTSELTWRLTEKGAAVQAVVREDAGLRPL